MQILRKICNLKFSSYTVQCRFKRNWSLLNKSNSAQKSSHRQTFYLLIPDDFWKDLFMDKILMAMVGPMSVLSLLGFIIPAFLGILVYIKDRHLK